MSHVWSPDVLGREFQGKRVLVTGSSRGIGAAVALALGSLGAKVAVHAHASLEAGEGVVAAIREAGGEAFLVTGDCRDAAAVEPLIAAAVEGLGGLDILINNAGTMVGRRAVDAMDEALLDEVLRLNVHSVVLATRAAVPHLKAAGGGSIINTSSIAARQGGGTGGSVYASAKAFVSNFTRSTAKELAAHHIRCNAVSPGTIGTDFHRRYSTPERLEKIAAEIPMGRIGVAEDCVGAYLFLASERLAGYGTGQIVEVNGGQFVG